MRRELGSFEQAQAITGENAPFNTVAVVRLRPSPEPASVRRSLGRLLRLRPLLGSSIVQRGRKRHHFEVTGSLPSVPFQVVDRADRETWKGAVESELQERIPSEDGPLVRCRLVRDDKTAGPAELLVTVHHAVVDISSGLATLHDLIDGLEDRPAVDARQIPASVSLPPSADSAFPDTLRGGLGRFARVASFVRRQAIDELSYRLAVRGHRQAPVLTGGHCRILPTALPEEDTKTLVRRCRAERVTLNSAVNAALLQAVLEGLYDGRRRPLRYIIFTDLRPFLDPPVPDGTSGCFVAVVRHTLEIRPNEDVWSLARRIQDQVLQSARRGERFLSSIVSPTTIKMLFGQKSSRMATVALSYTGPTDLPPRIGGYEIEALHTFASNFGRGPEYTAQARIRRGRLWWDIVYLDSDMDAATADGIAQDILRRLGHAGE